MKHPSWNAIEAYHQILAQENVELLWSELQGKMADNHLYFGERPICTVLRPHFLHPAEFERIGAATERVLSAMQKLYRALRSGEIDPVSHLHLSPGEAALTALPDRYGAPDVSGRMDAFWHPGDGPEHGKLYFLEYNADSPGGLAYGDRLSELFLEWTPMERLAQDFHVTSFPVRREVERSLRAVYEEWCHSLDRRPQTAPTVAIVDWPAVRTRGEFLLTQQVLESSGYRVTICGPDDLSIVDGRLYAYDEIAIDIVYKRLIVNELILRYPDTDELMSQPLVRAAAEGIACIANGFNCQLLYNKLIFALLSDETMHHRFATDEVEAITQHVPWTRMVSDGMTQIDGEELDLVSYIEKNREKLVLKPVRDYGGTGVVLGWECEPEAWNLAVSNALRSPHIVQERVPIPQAEFPIWQDNQVKLVPRLLDVDPYVWRGNRVAHAGVRLGTTSILNVSAGGGSATPLFLVEERRP